MRSLKIQFDVHAIKKIVCEDEFLRDSHVKPHSLYSNRDKISLICETLRYFQTEALWMSLCNPRVYFHRTITAFLSCALPVRVWRASSVVMLVKIRGDTRVTCKYIDSVSTGWKALSSAQVDAITREVSVQWGSGSFIQFDSLVWINQPHWTWVGW